MTDLTTRSPSPSSGSITVELAKMLGLVAPVTMSADQHTLWLASAVEALADISADEIRSVSLQVRRTVTRPSQIVPEVARLVSEKRESECRIRRMQMEAMPSLPKPEIPPIPREETQRILAEVRAEFASKRG